MRHRFKACFDGVTIDKRPENPGAQKTRAHACDGYVESGNEGHGPAAGSFFGKDWREELEVSNGDGIENERLVLLVVAHAIEMLQRLNARRLSACGSDGSVSAASCVFPQVVNNCSSGGERLGMVVQTESGKLRDAKLFAQNPFGVVALEDPVFETAFDAACAFEQRSFRGFEKLLRAGKERF